MAVDWTPHRFAGGVLALDVANTVVMRGDPRGFDRFADAVEIPRFAVAANRHRADELDGPTVWTDRAGAYDDFIRLRDTTDELFRDVAQGARREFELVPAFLRACADNLEGDAFQLAVARSALSLLDRERLDRIRICDNCGWLFLDRSRNGSRRWCDMTVCGNRAKAKRHYRRRASLEVT